MKPNHIALLLLSSLLVTATACQEEHEQSLEVVTEERTVVPERSVRRIDSGKNAERVISPLEEEVDVEEVVEDQLNLPVYKAETADILEMESHESAEEWFLGCSLGCAIGWKVETNSALPDVGELTYGVSNLDDGDLKTAWVEGLDGEGTGAEITFSFPKEYFDEINPDEPWTTTFSGFMMVNGYAKNRATYQKNSRVKRLRLYNNSEALLDISIEDIYGVQSVYFPPITIGPGSRITFEVLEVYPGSAYTDLAITELLPHGAH